MRNHAHQGRPQAMSDVVVAVAVVVVVAVAVAVVAADVELAEVGQELPDPVDVV